MQKMQNLTVFTVIVLIIALGQGVGALCPAAYIDLGTGCYHFGIQEVTSWEQAYFTCKLEMNGYLVEIESQQEQDNIKAYIKGVVDPAKEYSFWIGAADTLKSGEYRWMTSGNVFNFDAWYPGTNEPNNPGKDEHCVMLYNVDDYEWINLQCSDIRDDVKSAIKGICETDKIE